MTTTVNLGPFKRLVEWQSEADQYLFFHFMSHKYGTYATNVWLYAYVVLAIRSTQKAILDRPRVLKAGDGSYYQALVANVPNPIYFNDPANPQTAYRGFYNDVDYFCSLTNGFWYLQSSSMEGVRWHQQRSLIKGCRGFVLGTKANESGVVVLDTYDRHKLLTQSVMDGDFTQEQINDWYGIAKRVVEMEYNKENILFNGDNVLYGNNSSKSIFGVVINGTPRTLA